MKMNEVKAINLNFTNYNVSVFGVHTCRFSGGLGCGSAEDRDPAEQD